MRATDGRRVAATGRMSLTDRLTAAPVAADRPRRSGDAFRGFETGVRAESDGAILATTPDLVEMLGNEEDWRRAVQDLGIAVPDGWAVRLVEMRYDPAAWHRDVEGGSAVTRPVWRYRFKVEPATRTVDVDALLKRVRAARPRKAPPTRAADAPRGAFVMALGDTQFGKVDGDGVEGTIGRVYDSTERAVERLKELRRRGHKPEAVYLAWLGDCIEGFVSQGGANAWRTQTTLVEQVRIVRRLMLEQIDAFRGLADRVEMPVIPGNHDEAVRFGKAVTRYDDSWAVEAGVAVADAMQLNPEAYGHCSVVVPGRDELTLTRDVAGTITGFSHGHQARPNKMMDWWAGQAHGLQPIGEATLLFTAHLHHLRVEQGGPKTWIQVPALESESTWWRHRTGQVAPAGAVTALVGGGTWGELAVV